MSFKFVFLSPASDLAAAMSEAVPTMEIVHCASRAEALAALPTAQACFGTLDPELLAAAVQLKWLAAPAAGPPKGYYFPELIASDVVVTNSRGIFNDHISAHIMAFVLALSRGMHRYFRNQFAGQWQSGGESSPRPTCPKPPR